tara:strand:- start:84138 stop:84281 length:144 start_codon:yes stop_codon:yes gene_type:complete
MEIRKTPIKQAIKQVQSKAYANLFPFTNWQTIKIRGKLKMGIYYSPF